MKKKADIIFVSPPLIWGQENRMDIKPPLNLMYLASYLEKNSVKSTIIDVIGENFDFYMVLKTIKEESPAFLGLPLYHASLETVFNLCKEVKKILPSVKIIGGGPSITTQAEDLMKRDEIDIGVIGEGEITLGEVILSEEKDYKRIDGIAYKKDGISINRKREHINLDMLPNLDYKFVNMEPYFSYQKKLNIPETIFMVTSRGCPCNCIYCATPELWPGPLRRYSVERTIDEIKFHLAKFPGVDIGFMDDSFFSDKKWLNEFLDKIEGSNARFCCIGRADHLDKELVERLARAGCLYVALGIETGNQARQKKIKKYLDLEKTRKNVKLLADKNILTKCFFMLGFPDETPEEMVETINLAVDLRKGGMSKFNFFPVVIYPGTELAKRFPRSICKSKIYEEYKPDVTSISDFGERSLSMYSTIPDEDINTFLTGEELIELTKMAYNKVEKGEYINIHEINDLTRK